MNIHYPGEAGWGFSRKARKNSCGKLTPLKFRTIKKIEDKADFNQNIADEHPYLML